MTARTFVCPDCNGKITDFDTKTGIGTCPFCGAIVSDPDFAHENADADVGQASVSFAVEIPFPTTPAIPVSPLSEKTALILCVILGMLGVHRFYVGKIGTGIIWLLTGGGLLFGWVIDAVSIASGRFSDSKGRVLLVPNTQVDRVEPQQRVCAECESVIGANDQVCKSCGRHIKPWWNTPWGACVIIAAIIIFFCVVSALQR